MKSSNKLPLEKQKEIAERLKHLRTTAGYTQNDIAKKMGVTEKTYRKWEVGIFNAKNNTEYYPAIEYDNLFMLADIYHVSIDYLLCRSNCTSVDNHYISLKTGLSDKAIERITNKNGNTPSQDFLNTFILSNEYLEIQHNMYWIENNCHNISSHYKAFEEINTAIKKATDKDECDRLDNMRENYANKLEHNGNQIQYLIYQCSLSFGNFMNKIKKTWSKEVRLTLESMETNMPGLEKPKDN